MGNEKFNVFEIYLFKKKKVVEVNILKRGRGRLKKDIFFVIKFKVSGKGSGVCLLKSKLLIWKIILVKGWGELKLGWFLWVKGVVLFVFRKFFFFKEGV